MFFSPSFRQGLLLIGGATILSLANARSARADDKAEAQLLFEEGKALVAAGKVAEACPKFEAAAQLSRTPGVRLNLADCWERLGRTASALKRFREAQDLAEAVGDTPAADAARDRQARLIPQLTNLIVSVPGESAAPGLEITRDGEKLPPDQWGTPTPVDPGPHDITAKAPGRTGWSVKQAAVGAGSTVTVTVPPLRVEDGAEPRPSGGGLGTQRILALTSVGLGLVGVGVGSYFGVVAASKKSDYTSHTGANGQCLDSACQTLSHDASVAGTTSTIAFVAGGVFLATGAVLWFTAPNRNSPHITAALGPRGAGFSLLGGW